MGRSGANQSAVLFAGIGIMACGLSNSMQMLIVSRFVRSFHSILLTHNVGPLLNVIIISRFRAWVVEGYLQRLRKSRIPLSVIGISVI